MARHRRRRFEHASRPGVFYVLGASYLELMESNTIDKGPYEKQAAADKARYQKEMASYTPPAGDSKTGAKR